MSDSDLAPQSVLQILPHATAEEVRRMTESTPPSSVSRQWSRLHPILTANLRLEYYGASDEHIAAAEAATCPWTEEMRELYSCVEHADHRRGMLLLPQQFEILSLDRVMELHALWARLSHNPNYADPVETASEIAAEMAEPAGSPASTMLPGFIPFASSDADTLFVDTRHGPLHGSVNLWPDGGNAYQPPIWRSPSAMLENLVFALERNTPMSTRYYLWAKYQPYIEGDRLVWEPLR